MQVLIDTNVVLDIQNAVAESHDYDAVITRNKNDYKKSNLKVFSPKEFLEIP